MANIDDNEFLRAAFVSSPVPMALTTVEPDGSHRILRANDALCALLGYDQLSLQGQCWLDLAHTDEQLVARSSAEPSANANRTGWLDRVRHWRHANGHLVSGARHSIRLSNPDNTSADDMNAGNTIVTVDHLIKGEDRSATPGTTDRDTTERSTTGREAILTAIAAARTNDLAEVKQRFELSLRAARMWSWTYHIAADEFRSLPNHPDDGAIADGASQSQVFGQLTPQDQAKLRAAIKKTIATKHPFRVAVCVEQDKGVRWLELSGDAVGDESNIIAGVARDITTETVALRDEPALDAQLEISAAAGGFGAWELDPVAEEYRFDERSLSILGFEDDVPSRHNLAAIIHPDDRTAVSKAITAALRDSAPFDQIARLRNEAGDQRWVRSWGRTVTDGGTGVRLVGLVQDVTEEHRILLELEDRANRLELALTSTRTTIEEFDIEGDRSHMSDRWFESLGYDTNDLRSTGFNPASLVHPDDWHEFERKRQQHVDGHLDLFEDIFRVRRKDGTWNWHHLRGRFVDWDQQGKPSRMLAAVTDVTEQRRLEQQIAHSSTMQALASFSGGIAHDFNNIMAIVQGHTEALLHRDLDLAERTRRLGIILSSVERAKTLVRDLMHLTRPDPSLDLIVDLSESVERIATSLPYLLGEHIELRLDLTNAPTPVRIEPARLEAVVLNVAANSRDAMPTGGRLTLSSDTDTDTRGRSVINFNITDTGTGMSTQTLETMFEPFFSTKAPAVGTGLGMATTYSTITLAGGTITAESSIGQGTNIHICLPVADIVPVSEEKAPLQPPIVGDANAILVVEDDADILELTAGVLRDAGYRVHEALGGLEALEILEANSVDMVVTDAVMPMMSGAELAKTIKTRWPPIRILFQTGYAANTPATGAIDPRQVLYKPATEEELLQRVAALLHGRLAKRPPAPTS